ncbi:hypothetical protein [Granulicoccus phenolivorans]|uniref:hypothetical protein n=1 Tax=Granulicoccus phenolivorans TaxID=266854 RepID=UPI0007676DBE|nr:hypothetical protein [Granulicoccus phenolivorans]
MAKRMRTLAKVHETPDWYRATPAWSFSLIDHEFSGEWGWDKLGQRMGPVFDFLKQMESLTWKDITDQSYRPRTSRPTQKHHAIPQDKLCRDAQDRLVELELDDVDELFRFRTGFKERLWGIHVPDSGVFCLLWWDPNHRVYPLDG